MEMCSGSVVSLFETILVDEIEQSHINFLFIEITHCAVKLMTTYTLPRKGGMAHVYQLTLR